MTATAKPDRALRQITVTDLVEIFGAGVRDFRAAPRFGLFFGGIYAAVGWALLALLLYFGWPYLAYPVAMGFALVAPFAVVGLYTVSADLEAGRTPTWASVIGAIRGSVKRDLRWMALITGFSMIIWMDIAAFLLFAFVGVNGVTADVLDTILTTPSGLLFLVLGNTAGALIAMAVFSISVISFPMLCDRDIDFVTAMTTSVRLVVENPKAMLCWAALIGILSGLSVLSVFVGLLVVLPVIGHATWHLYRRAVPPMPEGSGAATASPQSMHQP